MSNIKSLKNNKYFAGQYNKYEKYKGWFIGSFFDDKNPCKTEKVEIQYKEQPAGHICKTHYHKKKVEILVILEGKAVFTVNDDKVELQKGDFLFIDVGNITTGNFIKNTKYFTIHAPSIPDDKVLV